MVPLFLSLHLLAVEPGIWMHVYALQQLFMLFVIQLIKVFSKQNLP